MKIALITGITGQDGSFLAELLLEKGYIVYGLIRKCSNTNTQRINHILNDIKLYYGDLTDQSSLINILQTISKYNPSRFEIYNLGAQSHVKVSFDVPEYTGETDAMGVLRILDAVSKLDMWSYTRFYQASTSELYGGVTNEAQNESTPFYPRSPYGVAKLYAFWIVKNWRESYNIFAVNGILFNHESERRGEEFVTRKITLGLGDILKGKREFIELGNIYSQRDWGYARDYVEGMWKMLQVDKPTDYVLATGETHTIKKFINTAFEKVGKPLIWEGKDENEVGKDNEGIIRVKINPKYYRPAEVDFLLGDASKAKSELGWTPKVSFDELVNIMINEDCF